MNSPTRDPDNPTSLAVQIVLFRNDPEQLLRLAEGLENTLRRARDRLGLSRLVVRLGDCSESRCLTGRDVGRLAARLEAADDHFYTHFEANLGSAGGSNALAAMSDEDAIWILNPDTYPSPDAATDLLRALSVASVGAAEGRQIPLEHPKSYDFASRETSWGSGCCLMVRRSKFERVGGFDDHFFPLYCDDVDFSWRLRLSGSSVTHVRSAAVFHDKRVDDRGSIEFSDTEVRSSALARLFLLHRYGRSDLAKAFEATLSEHGSEPQRLALDEFHVCVAAGDLPAVLSRSDEVADFVDGHYGFHRFDY